MDQIWARETVLTALKRRAMAGEPPVTLLDLQHGSGVGPGDLNMAVELLVEEGKVVRRIDGSVPSYEVAGEDELTEEAFVAGDAPEPAADEPPSPFVGPGPAAAAETVMANLPTAGSAVARPGVARELRMSSAMAQAMHPDAIGVLVMAGIIEAQDAAADFVFTVTP